MSIKVECDSCFGEFTVSDQRAGRRVACKLCGAAVQVPDDSEPIQPASRRNAGKKKSKKSGNSSGLMIGLGIGGGVAVLVGVITVVVMSGSRKSDTPVAAAPPTLPTATATTSPVSPPGSPSAPVGSAVPAMATVPDATPTTLGSEVRSEPTTTIAAAAPVVAKSTIPAESASAELSNSTATPTKRAVLDLPDLIAQVEPAVVRINVRTADSAGQGSGFVVDTNGTVVTNYHVMEGAVSANVQFVDNTTAKVIGVRYAKPKHDICIIQIEVPKTGLQTLSLAPELPRKGVAVVAFGAPLGLSFSSSEGIISGLRSSQEFAEELGVDVDGQWVQTTCAISPGNSGGPLTDRSGLVVGMNTMGAVEGQSLNFAVSSMEIATAIQEAPAEAKPLNKADLKPVSKSISRLAAKDEIGTPRGQKLFAEVDEIFLLNITPVTTLRLDPTGRIWDKVVVRSKVIVDRAKIPLSFGKPADDAAVLLVAWQMKPSRTGTAGTQELHIKATLVCRDVEAKANQSPYAKVWEEEDVVGTIALQSLAAGNFPRNADDKLAKYFTQFQTSYLKAVREVKEGPSDGAEKKSP